MITVRFIIQIIAQSGVTFTFPFAQAAASLGSRLRAIAIGLPALKGCNNYNNYRREYWILCATSRTISAHFARIRVKVATPAGEEHAITE
ncbi:hypothetical protein A8H26_21765 [Pluralibacter gergoviae]|nr:hypothetical protein A8H26_21765 [Pluralibacter gergoviae]